MSLIKILKKIENKINVNSCCFYNSLSYSVGGFALNFFLPLFLKMAEINYNPLLS